jgi:hypothetical protein
MSKPRPNDAARLGSRENAGASPLVPHVAVSSSARPNPSARPLPGVIRKSNSTATDAYGPSSTVEKPTVLFVYVLLA